MKIEILSNDDGSGLNSDFTVLSDYNPQNKIFNKLFGIIDIDDFVECFPENKQEKIINEIENGKIIFDVSKNNLIDKCSKLF